MGWVALAPDTLYMGMTDSDAGVLVRGTVAGDGGLAELFREQLPGSALQCEEEQGSVALLCMLVSLACPCLQGSDT